ncbi:hypothetical protein PEL8287_00360 [Roseovarius litorisediminis]|uniref:Cytochrome c domain-containing protein n=1 Tax=Roseovarius litorisediminis TaxID=1312363 RepID=A0A1Y5R9W8_9RHOB|nr:cytochrome c [Roseovarius litorisediminis]SLN12444.1 hypothetical protein PEL8287_00360 [Roseovarius litorisediminis]
MKTAVLFLAVAMGLVANNARSAEKTFGEYEYMNACAQCHGPEGKGNGPMAGFLSGSLPDLTLLQKNNGGVFPVTRVYEVIDGEGSMGPHGTREMPAWGNRFRRRAGDQMSFDLAVNPESFVRVRILALIEHLASIQED